MKKVLNIISIAVFGIFLTSAGVHALPTQVIDLGDETIEEVQIGYSGDPRKENLSYWFGANGITNTDGSEIDPVEDQLQYELFHTDTDRDYQVEFLGIGYAGYHSPFGVFTYDGDPLESFDTSFMTYYDPLFVQNEAPDNSTYDFSIEADTYFGFYLNSNGKGELDADGKAVERKSKYFLSTLVDSNQLPSTPTFKLTDASLAALRDEGIPDDTLAEMQEVEMNDNSLQRLEKKGLSADLSGLKGTYATQEEFETALEEAVENPLILEGYMGVIETHAATDDRGYFELTDQSLDELKDEVPSDILAKLETLKGNRYKKWELKNALKTTIGKYETEGYKSEILNSLNGLIKNKDHKITVLASVIGEDLASEYSDTILTYAKGSKRVQNYEDYTLGLDHALFFETNKGYTIAFEDIVGGGDADYEDLVINFSPTDGTGFSDGQQQPTPEPGTLLLLAIGMISLAIFGRKRMMVSMKD